MPERAPRSSPLEVLAVAVLATDGVEQVELEAPIGAMQVAGADVYIVTPSGDALRTVQDVSERQVVQSLRGENVDVFGFFESGHDVAISVLVVRGGILQDRRDFFFEKSQEIEPVAFLDQFLPQFYDANPFLPAEVHLPVAIPSPELLSEFLATKRGAKVAVRVPQRGAAADRLKMAETNARERHRVRGHRGALLAVGLK